MSSSVRGPVWPIADAKRAAGIGFELTGMEEALRCVPVLAKPILPYVQALAHNDPTPAPTRWGRNGLSWGVHGRSRGCVASALRSGC